jgi:hypothetical protein
MSEAICGDHKLPDVASLIRATTAAQVLPRSVHARLGHFIAISLRRSRLKNVLDAANECDD